MLLRWGGVECMDGCCAGYSLLLQPQTFVALRGRGNTNHRTQTRSMADTQYGQLYRADQLPKEGRTELGLAAANGDREVVHK